MNAQCNAPISDRFSSLCARVFYRRSAILKNRRGEGPGDEVVLLSPRLHKKCFTTVKVTTILFLLTKIRQSANIFMMRMVGATF